jgi:hypothetical protein
MGMEDGGGGDLVAVFEGEEAGAGLFLVIVFPDEARQVAEEVTIFGFAECKPRAYLRVVGAGIGVFD